tara:strand:- start:457 stop:849 length:393 start_codon:yes stop_codon:yes gene_type:complete
MNYNQILSIPINTSSVVVDGFKLFLPPYPNIYNKKIIGITISYYNTYEGQIDQGFLTLVDKNNNLLLYNYPLIDLFDASISRAFSPPPIIFNYRVTQFDLFNIDLQSSFVIYQGLSGGLTGALFTLNFYL